MGLVRMTQSHDPWGWPVTIAGNQMGARSLRQEEEDPVDFVWFIIVLFVFGLIAGAIARLLVPGRDPMGLVGTAVLGIVGSFVGGFLGYVLFRKDAVEGALQPASLLGSIIGAVIALLVYRAVSRRGSHRGYA
jgi:uncharacterized membrane protein YeaQ/YmgE (transglycosylase-associated protein family)